MRIVSVSFRNLNSLVGGWKINFDDPAMNSAGVFLITGPTGSGKTTILDAISLALYGRTPRLKSISDKQNEIMSRATGECLAEAVFETDEGRFRATWSQNRARGKASGKLQNPEHILAFESGEIIAEKKSAAAAEIVKKTGLTFDEFTQASLLAQGNFAKFLGADEDKKAELLEKITGSFIYGALSKEAHERNRTEKGKLDAIRQKLTALGANLLGDEEERAKAEELAESEKRLDELTKQTQAAGEVLSWLENVAKLRVEKSRQLAESAKIVSEIDAFQAKEEALRRAKIAEKGEPIRAALDVAIAELSRIREGTALKEKELDSLGLELEKEKENQSLLRDDTLKAKDALESSAPLFDSVKKLDAEIAAKKRETAERARRVRETRERRDEALRKKEREQVAFDNGQRKISEIQSRLAASQEDAKLRENLGTILEKLTTLETGLNGLSEIEKLIETERQNLRALLGEQGKLSEAREKSSRDWLEARAAKSRLEDERLKIMKGREIAYWERTIDELDAAYKSALERKELSVLRGELLPDSPCPLCGSLEHPWAGKDQIDDIDTIGQRREEARKIVAEAARLGKEIDKAEKAALAKNGELEKIQADMRGVESRKTLVEANIVGREGELAKSRTALEFAKRSLADLLAPLGLNRFILAPDLRERLKERRDARVEMEQAREEAGLNLAETEKQLAASIERLKAADEELAALEKDLSRSSLEENGKISERRALFGERSVEAEFAKFSAAVKLAEKRESESAERANSLISRTSSLKGAIAEGKKRESDWEEKANRCRADWLDFLSAANITGAEYLAWRKSPAGIESLEREKASLIQRKAACDALLRNATDTLAREEARDLSDKTPEEVRDAIEEARGEEGALREKKILLKTALDEQARLKIALRADREAYSAQERECAKWSKLDALIGSSDGKIFRDFAQNATLDLLLRRANVQLRRISPRYELTRSPDRNMAIQVIDNYQGGEIRPIVNLSGGESFIVSLSLALGLSSIASRKTSIGSLFLDEGFGTLDADTLETAMDALRSLSGEGKLVGVISHVDRLKEWIDARIEISASRSGRGEISATGCDAVSRLRRRNERA